MNLAPILPELILTVGAIVLMMVAAFLGRRGSAFGWASVALLVASVTLLGEPQNAGDLWRADQADGFGAFGKLIIYLLPQSPSSWRIIGSSVIEHGAEYLADPALRSVRL
jgi:NADH:ubiquinone oxidoreductase subunit 2 (subunit N)